MGSQEKQDITTGRPQDSAPILANDEGSTAGGLKTAPTRKEYNSTEIALILALLQTDFSDLQSKGLKVAILAKDGKLYASIELPGHGISVSDTGKKYIMLDGKAVTDYE
jgi:hypothetical protein